MNAPPRTTTVTTRATQTGVPYGNRPAPTSAATTTLAQRTRTSGVVAGAGKRALVDLARMVIHKQTVPVV
jgi:hypothetical protein